METNYFFQKQSPPPPPEYQMVCPLGWLQVYTTTLTYIMHTMLTSYLHIKHQYYNIFKPQQISEGVHEQINKKKEILKVQNGPVPGNQHLVFCFM